MKPGMQADVAMLSSMPRVVRGQAAPDSAAPQRGAEGCDFLHALRDEEAAPVPTSTPTPTPALSPAQGEEEPLVVAFADGSFAALERLGRCMGDAAAGGDLAGKDELPGQLAEKAPPPGMPEQAETASEMLDVPHGEATLELARVAMMEDGPAEPAEGAPLPPAAAVAAVAAVPRLLPEVVPSAAGQSGVVGARPQGLWRAEGQVRGHVVEREAGDMVRWPGNATSWQLPEDSPALVDRWKGAASRKVLHGVLARGRGEGDAGFVRQMPPRESMAQEMPVQVVQAARQQFLPPSVAMPAAGAGNGSGAGVWSAASQQVLQVLRGEGLAALLPEAGGPRAVTKVVQRLEIQLHPASLGTVNAQLSLSGGRLRIDIKVPDKRMVEHLRDGIEQLERRIKAHDAGVAQTVVRVVVDATAAQPAPTQPAPAQGQGIASGPGTGPGMQEFARQDGGGDAHSPRRDGGHADDSGIGGMDEDGVATAPGGAGGAGAVYL